MASGWALITATSANGHSDSSYVKVGDPAPGLSAIARQWMWDQNLNPDQIDLGETAPSGFPYLLHYALDVSPLENLPIELRVEGNQFMSSFPGNRSDLIYGGLSSDSLSNWNTTEVSAPDARGMRSISTEINEAQTAFLEVQVSKK
ncbi:MAG: hypothetical protein P8L44_13790 [Opitutales bacterium]|jgi:hypothetical protein|nr:hypothetical protein [Opitutales bacterium]